MPKTAEQAFLDEMKKAGQSKPGRQDAASEIEVYNAATAATRDDRMRWFRDARFGMIIHWGLYSVLARHEWVMLYERIPLSEYEPLADQWHPEPGAPKQWAALAKKAGMTYMVLTTKHHEGFLLWDSKMGDYNAARRGPGRDLVREYVEACRAEGLKVGLYYSLMDWHHPDGLACNTDEAARRRFLDYTHGCVRELMSNYGRIDLLFYDVPMPLPNADAWESVKLNRMVRELQPHIIINNRAHLPEDYCTPEEHVTAAPEGQDWEALMTFNGSWGYMPTPPEDYHSVRKVLDMIRTAAAGQGNLMLNIGPRADGSIPATAVKRLTAVGRWLKKYGGAVYGNVDRPLVDVPFSAIGDWSCKDGKLYFWCRNWPGNQLAIGGLRNEITQVRLYPDGEPLPFGQTEDPRLFAPSSNERLLIRGLPDTCPDTIAKIALIEMTLPTWQSRFITRWQQSKLLPPVEDIAQAPGACLADPLGWQPVQSENGGFLNIHNRVGDADGFVYLAARVETPEAGTWECLLGHDGGARMFVDGKPVFAEARQKNPCWPDRSVFPVALTKGTHEIVVAFDMNEGAGWGIYLRFQTPEAARTKAGKPVFPIAIT